jgi:hypothetical protein
MRVAGEQRYRKLPAIVPTASPLIIFIIRGDRLTINIIGGKPVAWLASPSGGKS